MPPPSDVFLDPTVQHKGWNLEDPFVVSYDPIDYLDVYFSLETLSTETVCNTVSYGRYELHEHIILYYLY